MKINKVSPYEGDLVWVGEPRTGIGSRTGKTWASIDFTIRYNDGQSDKHITFNAFGEEKVGQVMSAPKNGRIRVVWEPESRESNGKWWSKNSVIELKVVNQQEDDDLPEDDLPL